MAWRRDRAGVSRPRWQRRGSLKPSLAAMVGLVALVAMSCSRLGCFLPAGASATSRFSLARHQARPSVAGALPLIAGRRGSADAFQSSLVPRRLDIKFGEYGINEASLWTTLALFILALPGAYSTVQRTGMPRYVEKVYVMPGPANGGLEMRSIAAGVFAYFKSMNYAMQDSPQEGKIRFVGNLQPSITEAGTILMVVAGAFLGLGVVLYSLYPEGPLNLGPQYWFAPVLIFTPVSGAYYWQRAYRRDIVELMLESTDEPKDFLVTLTALGDRDTIENLQRGVRFRSPASGKLYQLMEQGMEYQPGMFEPTPQVVIDQKEAA